MKDYLTIFANPLNKNFSPNLRQTKFWKKIALKYLKIQNYHKKEYYILKEIPTFAVIKEI